MRRTPLATADSSTSANFGHDVGRRDVRAAAELDGVLAPLVVAGIGEQFWHRRADGHDAHGIGVALAEHGAEIVDLHRFVERHRLDVNR